MPKRKYDPDGYPSDPVRISGELWFFAEKEGMHVITASGFDHGVIPWPEVTKAQDDRRKAARRRTGGRE